MSHWIGVFPLNCLFRSFCIRLEISLETNVKLESSSRRADRIWVFGRPALAKVSIEARISAEAEAILCAGCAVESAEAAWLCVPLRTLTSYCSDFLSLIRVTLIWQPHFFEPVFGRFLEESISLCFPLESYLPARSQIYNTRKGFTSLCRRA